MHLVCREEAANNASHTELKETSITISQDGFGKPSHGCSGQVPCTALGWCWTPLVAEGGMLFSVSPAVQCTPKLSPALHCSQHSANAQCKFPCF